MLFYSRYQSEDPADFSAELTKMQACMMQYNEQPIHRKPYLYPLPDTMSYEELRVALYRTISSHATLQVMFKYDKHEQHYVQYVEYLPPLEQWQVPVVKINMLPEMYIVTQESSISLLKGYPWRVKFLEHEEQRYLYIEFHAICLDDYSAKCFEDVLFRSLISGFELQAGNLSSYRLLRNMEIISSKHIFSGRDAGLRGRGSKENKRMIAVTYSLTAEQLLVMRQIAKKYAVDIPVVYQLLVEQLLGYSYEGERYGIVENWRSTLRNYDEIGCFNYLSEEYVDVSTSLEGRLIALQLERKKRLEGELGTLGNRHDYSVMYCYEEELCQHFTEVQADQYCMYDLVLRVKRSQNAAHIKLEYRQQSYTREQIQQYVHRISAILERLRQQLLASHAS